MRLFLVFLLLLTTTTGSFIDDIFGWVGNLIDDAAEPLVDNAKDAFVDAMDEVVTNDLVPLVQMIQALLDRDIQEVDEDVKALVANLKDFIQKEVQQMASLAEMRINKTVEEIKTEIITTFFKDLTQYTGYVLNGVNTILNKIQQMEQKFICTEISVVNEIMQALKEAFGIDWWIVDPWDSCREFVDTIFPDYDLRYKFFSEYTPLQLYYYTKCTYINPLTQNSPIIEIRAAYLSWGDLAANMRCGAIATDDQDLVIFYLKEMGEASGRYHIWDNAIATLSNINAHHVPKSLCKQASEMKLNQQQISTKLSVSKKQIPPNRLKAGPNCSTPLECFEEAYNMLIEAQKDIQKFKDLAIMTNNMLIEAQKDIQKFKDLAIMANRTASSAITTATSALKLANSSNLVVGSIVAYGSTTPPPGWLLCDGSVLNLNIHPEYTKLAHLIGYAFDPQKASYALPDLRGRVIVGVGNGSGLTPRTIGNYFGEETHVLTLPETFYKYHEQGSDITLVWGLHKNAPVAPHNNMQPSLTTNYIIKY